MATLKTQAVVIRSLDFGESDKLVTFFTKDLGKVKGIAKGAKRSKRRFGVNLEIFSLVLLYLREGRRFSLPLVEACDLINPFLSIRGELLKIAQASYFLELIDEMMPEREANERLFQLLTAALSTIEEGELTPSLSRVFEMKFLSLVGLSPQLYRCVVCQLPLEEAAELNFNSLKGGLVCPLCVPGAGPILNLSQGTVKTLRRALELPLERMGRLLFSQTALREAELVLSDFLKAQLGKELKTVKFISRLS